MKSFILVNGKIKLVFLTSFIKYFSTIYYIGRTRLSSSPYILKQGNTYHVNLSKRLENKLYDIGIDLYDFKLRCKQKDIYQLDLSTECENSVSYLDKNRFDSVIKGKKCINNTDFRYRCKFGKLLSKLDYSDGLVEYYFNKFKPVKGIFEVVTGEKIPFWYSSNNYSSNCGTLNDSCMRHMDSSTFDIYVDNCEMLILKDENTNLLLGRALLWGTKIGKVLDRIYGTDETIEKFKMYAASKGIIYKYSQNYSEKTKFVVNGNIDYIELSIKLKHGICNYSLFPYIDTFTYLDDDIIYNTDKGSYTASNTDGTLDGYNDDNENYVIDYYGDRQHIDDVTYVDNRHDYYPNDMVCFCGDACYLTDECVNIDGDYYHKDSDRIKYSDYHGKYIHENDAIFVESENDYFYDDDVCYIENKNEYFLLTDCVQDYDNEWQIQDECIDIEGEWYHKDSDEITCIDNEYFLTSNLVDNV